MPIEIRDTQNIDRQALHAAMLDAFSDYDIPLQPTLDQFNAMLAQRQFDPALSSVAMDGDQVLAFWLIGTDDHRAHLIASGTRIAHRGKGLAKKIAARAEAEIIKAGYKLIQFECLTSNQRALDLYLKQGHEIEREFDCFSMEIGDWAESDCHIKQVDWDIVAPHTDKLRDVMPSWQNEDFAIAAAPEAICLAAYQETQLVGYIATAPSDAVYQLAVAPTCRHQHIGQTLIKRAAHLIGKPTMAFINIDKAAEETIGFLTHLGARKTVSQYELIKRF
ncbi:GNAT family N-acetyltransferase [Maritalea mediterranea]|uniref:GNAT family N-acetyltransferase n=1 Tax=Maritalea mediterranea TaxID=2909667 RepID=A0ABS9E7W7_9HYPH|nr:GNAT family N-acetyltransferase [Maritalea mediterranea]MCF4098975.1 GNAT family N-acetyltransferase [Maritalea mediterranea]